MPLEPRTWSCNYSLEHQSVAVRAERPIERGEELTMLYGQYSAARFTTGFK